MKEKINVAELLKNCPKGMELDCTICNGVKFIGLDKHPNFPIGVRANNGYEFYLTKHGQVHNMDEAKCVIFPKGKTSWEGFVSHYKFKDGDIVFGDNGKWTYVTIYKEYKTETSFYHHLSIDSFGAFTTDFYLDMKNCRLATEKEKQKLFKALQDKGYKWNAETKNLEKLFVPKFKVGDKIKLKKSTRNIISTVTKINDDGSISINGYELIIKPELQDKFELVPNKFDITTLKPFESIVLVRDENTDEWRGHFFSYYNNSNRPYVCIGVGGINEFKQCIPYDGNEHLLGTTDDCDEYFKTWEE